MGTLMRFGKVRLLVRGLEHGRIHFHLEGPNVRCVMDAETLETLAGAAPAHLLIEVRAWAKEHRSAILEAWRKINE